MKRPDGELGVWGETPVQKWKDVKRLARIEDRKAHIGRIFDIIVEESLNFLRTIQNRSSKAEPSLRAITSETSEVIGRYSNI